MFESMDYRLIKDHIENKFQLQWNWSWFLAFVIFWVFSFYGAVYTQNVNLEILIIFSIIFLIIFLILIYLGVTKLEEYEESINIKNKDIYVFISYFLILVLLCWNQLTSVLISDSINHAVASKKHALSLIFMITNKTTYFDLIPLKDLLYAIDLFSFKPV